MTLLCARERREFRAAKRRGLRNRKEKACRLRKDFKGWDLLVGGLHLHLPLPPHAPTPSLLLLCFWLLAVGGKCVDWWDPSVLQGPQRKTCERLVSGTTN